jgi:hypothetical protein
MSGSDFVLTRIDSGRAQGWGTALECTTKPCGRVPAHCRWSEIDPGGREADLISAWINTTIILDKPSMAYRQTHHPIMGATGSMMTSDNGKTWLSDKFSIPTHFFQTA